MRKKKLCLLSQDLQLALQGYDEVVFEGVEGYKIQLLLGYVLSACFVGVKDIARSYPMGPTLLISHCSLKLVSPSLSLIHWLLGLFRGSH